MTATKNTTIQDVLNQGNLNEVADALRLIKAGNALSPVKVIFSGLGSSASVDITTAASKAAATIVSGIALDPDVQPNLPAIGIVKALRPTTGSAGALARYIGDAGAAASTTVALLSDDGKTLTFEAAVTGFYLEYYPAPAVAMTNTFAPET